MMSKQWKMDSPIGVLWLVASETALEGVYWDKQDVPMERTKLLVQAERELAEYLAGRRRDFSVPLSAKGTPFQKKVWAQLSRIPYGKTRSYSEIAARIASPRAVRAVGTANGRNPLSIIVPCHRVIAADGTLGGYAGGLDTKSKLLALEGVALPRRKV